MKQKIGVVYSQKGWEAYIWSSSLNDHSAVYADFYATREDVNMWKSNTTSNAYSIRCFKDEP